MAKCFACFKRARKDICCLYCRRGPMCIGCVCPCRKKEKGTAPASTPPVDDQGGA